MNEETKRPVWLETWLPLQTADIEKFGIHAGQWNVYEGESHVAGYAGPPISEERARLIAAAPTMLRALLELEWQATCCDGLIDHVLAEAGLTSQASRNEAREMMRKEKIVVRAQTT